MILSKQSGMGPGGWCEDTGSGSILVQVHRFLNGSTLQHKERLISYLRELLDSAEYRAFTPENFEGEYRFQQLN